VHQGHGTPRVDFFLFTLGHKLVFREHFSAYLPHYRVTSSYEVTVVLGKGG